MEPPRETRSGVSVDNLAVVEVVSIIKQPDTSAC
jgi:hypothetical protein